MGHLSKQLQSLFIIGLIVLLAACGSSDDDSGDNDSNNNFSVQVSPTAIELMTGQQAQLSYIITNANNSDVQVEITTNSTLAEVSIDQSEQLLTFNANQTTGTDQIVLTFSNSDQSLTITIPITVSTDNSNGGDDGSDDGSGDDSDSGDDTSQESKRIYWPSDYITLFEDEEVTLNLARNYQINDPEVIERFFLNSANISGRLSEDKSQYILKAQSGETDTYGELLAITEVNGVITEQLLQIIYYNKNRDLTTVEPPVIALIEPQIELEAGTSTSMVFDIYDPDSDRIAYRVIDSPSNVQTHVNRTAQGYELTVSLLSSFEQTTSSPTLTLEVSDAHLIDQIDIDLIETTNSNSEGTDHNRVASATVAALLNTESDNQPPQLFLEENVTVSLIKQVTGQETEEVASFAFAFEDENPDFIEVYATSTNPDFTFEFDYPYFSVFADDITNLQHEQITLTADDGFYTSKLTFHLYTLNNFTEFFGGNVNIAPIISASELSPVLESKSIEFEVSGSDFEGHDYTIEAITDAAYATASVDQNNVLITTELLAESESVITDIEIIATDVFGSDRSLILPLEIYKNTPPVINTIVSAIDLVSTGVLEVELTVTDVDEGSITPTFEYDESLVTIEYESGIASIQAANVDIETTDTIIVTATDEFGETVQLELPLIVRINNQSPVIDVATNEITIAPGQTQTVLLTYSDPDGTALTISRFTSDTLLSFTYNQVSGELSLTLDPSADFQQNMTFTTIASDGFIEVSETITVIVPVAPEPPTIEIEPFNPNVDEGEFQIVNFATSDINGDNVIITTADGGSGNIDQLTISQVDDSLRIEVPGNVISEEPYLIEVIATDDSSSQLSSSVIIQINAIPENDPPLIELSSPVVTLVNDYRVTVPYTITDIDNFNNELTIQVFDENFEAIPTTIDVIGFDINGIILKAATKGAAIDGEQIVIRVTDPGNLSSSTTLTVSKVLENEPPEINYDTSPKLIDMGDNTSVNVVFYISDPDIHDETNAPEDVVSVTSVTADNQFGNASAVNITNLVTFTNRIEFTINSNDVVLTDSDSRLPVSLAIILTDGYVSVLESIRVNIRDEDI